MISLQEVVDFFQKRGGRLNLDLPTFESQLLKARVFLFDWDGVFNDGTKMNASGSPFSEPDSMGTNMMRFSYYLKHGVLPVFGVVTGAKNEGASYFAEREHFDLVIRGINNKKHALELLIDHLQPVSSEVLFAWDDILDLPIASWAKTSIQVRRDANPILNRYADSNRLATYRTASIGGATAVRELSEIYLAAMGNASECIEMRSMFTDEYQDYLKIRQAIQTFFISNV